MTNFVKSEFTWHGGYLGYGQYPVPHADRLFIGRFKYGNAGKCARHLRDWLIKNMTVEEYRDLRAQADKWETRDALSNAMEARGYLQFNLGEACARHGYPRTQAGFAAYKAAGWLRADVMGGAPVPVSIQVGA